MPLISVGRASGSATNASTSRPMTPRLRASRYASGVPSTVITAVATVAVNSDVASAEPSPGTPGAPPARRTANATIGTSRYRASSPPSQGSGLLARLRTRRS